MKKGSGISVSGGIALGPVRVIHSACLSDRAQPDLGDVSQGARVEAALSEAGRQLEQLAEQSRSEVGTDQAMILETQQLMLNDPDFITHIQNEIQNGASAMDAVLSAGARFNQQFSLLDDPYMKARAADVQDITQRLCAILGGFRYEVRLDKPCILAAEDLTPSQTVQLPRDLVLAIVTRCGSENSHTAILARARGIPALVQADLDWTVLRDDMLMVVDGGAGLYWLDPDQTVLEQMDQAQRDIQKKAQGLVPYMGKATVTRGGRSLTLCANIGLPEDVTEEVARDAEGIGLFRSEFLYLGQNHLPSEDELVQAYTTVLRRMNGKRVVIRTLDVGADKRADYLNLDREENPALGLRGVRFCLERDELFRHQIRAIYRASAFGTTAMMVPMISSLWEVREVRALCRQAEEELTREGTEFGPVEFGIMIETPAAALISDQLAAEVDFFSLGTNDLTQYTLAADRQNGKLERYRDPYHPAVRRLIEESIRNGHAAGIWVGICGELAGDEHAVEDLLRMGVDELSVSPDRILSLRKLVCESEVN